MATGGHRLNQPGSFLAPTIICDATPDMQIAGTEVFGPVLTILKADSEATAIDITNSTEYGLVGGIFTADIDAAHRAARKFVQARYSSMNGMLAVLKPRLAAMANRVMAVKKAERRCGITSRQRTSPIAPAS